MQMTSTEQRQVLRKTAFAAGIGNFMEWFDFAVYGFFAVTIGKVFFRESSPATALLASLAVFGVAFLFRPIGGLVLGSIGDTKGRRVALSLSVGMMGLATTLIAVLPTYKSAGLLAPALLILLRCIQGFSAGGEWTGSAAFLLENAPRDKRGLYGSVISATAAIAVIAGSLLALLLATTLSNAQMESFGWRIPFLCAAPLAIVGLYVRLRLDETPVFKKLRAEDKVVDKPLRQAGTRDWKAIILTLAFASVQGLGYYYLATYVFNYLSTTVGVDKTKALLLCAIGLTIYAVLCPVAGRVSDRYGRRLVNIGGSVAYLIVLFPAFMLMGTGRAAPILLGILLLVVCQSLVSVTTVVMLVELFPAATRASGSATGFNLALAFIAGPGPFIATAIANASGSAVLPAVYLVAVTVAALAVLIPWLPETAGRDIHGDAGSALDEARPTVIDLDKDRAVAGVR